MAIEMDKRYNGHKRLLGLVEQTYKRVRTTFNGETIADTPNAYILYDHIYAPRYLFPKQDVQMSVLTPQTETTHSRMYKTITHYDIKVRERSAEKVALTFANPQENQDDISDYVGFDWNKMDAWFVEDEEVIGHARHPYLRTDVRDSKRRVQVIINDTIIADTTNAVFLFETGLLPRYYIPLSDIKGEYLQPTTTHTVCPYKGVASYYDVMVDGQKVEDVGWYYPTPNRGLEAIIGKIAFYNEHDAITIKVADH